MQDVRLKKRGVYLGRVGETGRYRVWLDVSEWEDEYSGGTGLFLLTNPEGTVLPMATSVVTDEDDVTKMYGEVTDTETAIAGVCVIEATWTSGGVLAKSDHFNALVLEATYTGETTPDSTPTWVRELMTELAAAELVIDQADEVQETVEQILENINGAEADAEQAAEDAEAWAVGERGGEPVESGDETYGNNSRQYARDAEAWAKGTRGGEADAERATDNSKYYSEQAASSAAAAAVSEANAFAGTPNGYSNLVSNVNGLTGNVSSLMTAVGSTGQQTSTVTVDLSGYVNDNHFWNSETTTAVLTAYSGYRSYDDIPVLPGDVFSVTIYRKSSVKQHAVLLTDDSHVIQASYGHGTGSTDGEETYDFTVPLGATKMLLTTGKIGSDWKIPTVTKAVTVVTFNSVPDLIDRVEDLEAEDVSLDGRLDTAETDIDTLENAVGYAESNDPVTVNISAYVNDNHFWNSQAATAVLTAYSDYRSYDDIPVQPGDVISVTIYRKSSAKQHAVLLTDDSHVIQASYGHGTGSTDGEETYDFTVPSGATKMLLTTGKIGGAWQVPTVTKTTTGTTLNSVPALITRVNGLEKILSGKKVAVIGDSISTNGNTGTDANVPEIIVTEDDVGVELSAYLTYYDVQAGLTLGGHTFTSGEIGTEVTFTPVEADVGKSIGRPLTYNANSVTVWWEVMQEALGNTTIPVCWSGASITSHEGTASDYKTSYAWHDATIRKCGIRTAGSMVRTAPDVIIIYRGTNDFSHAPYAKLTDGYFDSCNWQYPADDEVTGGYGYKEGLCLTVQKLRTAYPNAQIWLCTLNVFKRVSYSRFPTNNGTNSLPQYNEAIRETAAFLGCGVIDFARDGITFENCYSGGYITDSAATPTHPSDKGHRVMGRKAIADIRAGINAMD